MWKTKIRASVSSNQTEPNGTVFQYQNSNASQSLSVAARGPSKSISEDARDLDKILKEYEATIEKQREQIKFKNEQLEQQKSVFQYEKQQQYAELTKEINHLKNQRQV